MVRGVALLSLLLMAAPSVMAALPGPDDIEVRPLQVPPIDEQHCFVTRSVYYNHYDCLPYGDAFQTDVHAHRFSLQNPPVGPIECPIAYPEQCVTGLIPDDVTCQANQLLNCVISVAGVRHHAYDREDVWITPLAVQLAQGGGPEADDPYCNDFYCASVSCDPAWPCQAVRDYYIWAYALLEYAMCPPGPACAGPDGGYYAYHEGDVGLADYDGDGHYEGLAVQYGDAWHVLEFSCNSMDPAQPWSILFCTVHH